MGNAEFYILAKAGGIEIEDLLGWLARNEMQLSKPPPPPLGATEAELGGALSRYVGTFCNDDLGTVRMRAEDGRLAGAIGELGFVVRVTSPTEWEMRFDGGGGGSIKGRPRLAGDRMAAIELDVFGTLTRFDRKD